MQPCSSGDTVSVTYSERVFVDLGIHHAMRMRHIVICHLLGSTIFFHIISQNARYSEKEVNEHKMCFDFLYSFYPKQLLFQEDVSEISSKV